VFNLTLQNGPDKGATWPVTDGLHRLGRARECEIALDHDATVSREHCELQCSGQWLLLRPLGKKSITLLNGGVVLGETRVKPGDTLALGMTQLLVTAEKKASAPPTETTPDFKTQGLQSVIEAFAGRTPARAAVPAAIDTVEDLVVLLSLSQNFSMAESSRELEAACLRVLQERLAPAGVWIVRSDSAEPRLLLPSDTLPNHHDAKIMHWACKVMETQDGRLFIETVRGAQEQCVISALVAPLVAGGVSIGVIAAATHTPRGTYDEDDRRFFTAFGRTLGPCMISTERAENLAEEVKRLRAAAADTGQLLGTSPAMVAVREALLRAAASPLSVMLLGESGTGKELAARFLHQHSAASAGPLIAVNCAAIPTELLESELFGHERGAFTGAAARRLGLVEQAHGGTLFLDEIGDLALDHQARLLRLLEHGTFRRLGGETELTAKFRLVTATNRPIEALVQSGHFREDLYHRINGFEIQIPPLRERRSDIPLLVDHFLNLAQSHATRTLRGVSLEAMALLQAAPWPGNVRELRNAVDRAVHVANGAVLQPEDFQPRQAGHKNGNGNGAPMIALVEAEQRHLAQVLAACDGDVKAAAAVLDLPLSTVYRKLKKHGIEL
jgi:DNA-binding NtrC family response regulator/pSer/pThr/pTyr-binding forkhead associated (FHA) protein